MSLNTLRVPHRFLYQATRAQGEGGCLLQLAGSWKVVGNELQGAASNFAKAGPFWARLQPKILHASMAYLGMHQAQEKHPAFYSTAPNCIKDLD